MQYYEAMVGDIVETTLDDLKQEISMRKPEARKEKLFIQERENPPLVLKMEVEQKMHPALAVVEE